MATYSIKDLEKISGIKAHTLRIWEQRFSILHPKRTDTNIRFYDDNDLRLILSISMLNQNGVKISRIANMQPEEIHMTCHSLQDTCKDHEQMVSALIKSMVEYDEARFEKTLSACTLKFGFEETMMRVIHPFYERVGILWQTGSIRPAQEHFISNLIRQKLIVAIDAQEHKVDTAKPKVILFLPEHEMHEIGLLFAMLLLRSRGYRVIYLGQSVPEEDLVSVSESFPAAFLFTIITIQPDKGTVAEYLKRLSTRFPKSTILATGQAAFANQGQSANVRILQSPKDLIPCIEDLARAH